jgi:hypothetical protein
LDIKKAGKEIIFLAGRLSIYRDLQGMKDVLKIDTMKVERKVDDFMRLLNQLYFKE